jgi:DNA-binding transcriptional ArsR family regulator
MPTPLHQLKAEFFKSLGHPVRIRILELLREGPRSVGEMLPDVGVEASHLSQQLAVLRRSGLVSKRREGSAVFYSLPSTQVTELLAVAEVILASLLSEQLALLKDLQTEPVEASGDPTQVESAPVKIRGADA